MRPVRGAVLGALTSAALLAPAAVALAAGEPGGAAAPATPAAPQAGGSQFGVPATVLRPTVAELRVPSSASPGRPPSVSVEVVEHGVGTVSMRVLIRSLTTRRVVVTAEMGWVHTSRRLTVAWPSGARLVPGSYRVSISAHDHLNGNLLRTAHSSGAVTLLVKSPPGPKTPSPSPEPSPTETGVPTPAQTVADGAVFPVGGPHNFGGPEDRFGAPRAGHTHQGQDVLTAEGTPDLAPLSGSIESTSYQAGGAGYYIVEHTSVGLDFFFAHCEAGSFAVTEGQGVSAGQQLCRAGQTGDATAPHLHFEMWVGGWQAAGGRPIDPLPYLEAWERG